MREENTLYKVNEEERGIKFEVVGDGKTLLVTVGDWSDEKDDMMYQLEIMDYLEVIELINFLNKYIISK